MTRRSTIRDREAIEALGWLQEALGVSAPAAATLLAGEGEAIAHMMPPDALSEHHETSAGAATGNPAALLLGVYAFLSGTSSEDGDDADDADETGDGSTMQEGIMLGRRGRRGRAGTAMAPGPAGGRDTAADVRRRRNVTTLSADEMTRLQNAIWALRDRGVYRQFVMDHAASMGDAHGNPAFLPWHRQFILHFESELRAIDPGVALPYWDWSNDPGLVSGAPQWNDAMVRLLGGNGDPGDGQAVNTGPFARWFTYAPDGTETTGTLAREFGGASGRGRLPGARNVAAALGATRYDTTLGFRNMVESGAVPSGMHNAVHGWVGGQMGWVALAPNDPCFFLHHCFVDKLWADWQATTRLGYEPRADANVPIRVWRVTDERDHVTFRPSDTLDLNNLRDHRGRSGIRVVYE